MATEALEASVLWINLDDRERQLDDLVCEGGASGFGVEECDLHGVSGWMLGLPDGGSGMLLGGAYGNECMNKWFYEKDGEAVGPLSTPEMHELIQQGGCTRTTLVWTRGMRDWLPACMAAWMWEERAPETGVTSDRSEGGAHGAAAESPESGDHANANADAAHHVSMPPALTPATAGHAKADPNAQTDAGVLGAVRKLFGLG